MINREQLLEKLYNQYHDKRGWRKKWIYWRKKLLWHLLIGSAKGVKRLLDILLSIVLMILFAPLFFLSAVCIKLYDRGPVLYITNRVGLKGREFRFPKLRSMEKNAEIRKGELLPHNAHGSGVTFKMKRDPRTTSMGRFLRKTSLDELPQLWCVLKGEMSLVGPRPPLPEEVSRYTLEERRRLDVKPGLTCIWQVSGRSELPFDQQCSLDLKYIQSQSLLLDLKILLKTIPVVLIGKGAY